MLERRRGGQMQRRFQLPHQLPCVECVEKVDVPRASVEYLHGQRAAVLHEDAGRLLVGVAAVLKRKFRHVNLPAD